jgi:prophage tail gpP-like protein
MDKIELIVGGQNYDGWTEAVICRDLKAFAGGFRIQITDNVSGTGRSLFIKIGDKCVLKINGQTVVTGWIEECQSRYDANSHAIEIAGRDKTCDLVDCSVVYKTHEILNSNLLQIAKKLCEPFSITVKAETDVGEPFKNFSIQPGETVFEALTRGANHRGVLFNTDGEGNLVIIKPGTGKAVTALKEGENVKEASVAIDTKERFSQYIIKGQVTATDENYAANASQIEGQATDPGITRYRPMVIVAEKQATTAEAKKRAQWEAAHRAAESTKITIVVQGFGQINEAPLWKLNDLVSVDLPLLGINQELLIGELEFRLDGDGGSQTTLTCQRADAYVPQPTVDKAGDPTAGYSE